MKNSNIKSTPSKTTVFAIGVTIAIGVSALMLILFAFLFTVVNLPKAATVPLSSISLGMGALIGARCTAKKLKAKGYLCGIIIACLLFAISTIIAIIINGVNFTSLTPLRFIVVVLMGMIGGITGINTTSKRSLVG